MSVATVRAPLRAQILSMTLVVCLRERLASNDGELIFVRAFFRPSLLVHNFSHVWLSIFRDGGGDNSVRVQHILL